MPTYDYECTHCGHVYEMYQPITAKAKRKPDAPCAKCGKEAPIRRLIGGGGAVIFKGSGFYETDYRSESYKQAAKADSEASKPKSESGAEKSAYKPADKTAGKTTDKTSERPAAQSEAAPRKPKRGAATESAPRSAKAGD